MTSAHKLGAILFLWIAGLIAIAVMVNGNAGMDFGTSLLGVFILIGVGGTSIAITQMPTTDQNASARKRGNSKLKNNEAALVDRLIDSMSDEELAALRRRLGDHEMRIGDDGELVQIQRGR
jgi:hypothetical protein